MVSHSFSFFLFFFFFIKGETYWQVGACKKTGMLNKWIKIRSLFSFFLFNSKLKYKDDAVLKEVYYYYYKLGRTNVLTPNNQNTIDKRTKGCILPFPKKCDLGIAKN